MLVLAVAVSVSVALAVAVAVAVRWKIVAVLRCVRHHVRAHHL